jgi:hypothetical protein
VLEVLDGRPPDRVEVTSFCTAGAASVVGGRVAFLRPEAVCL